LESRTSAVATDGLVDTGATTTFIPREIADTIALIPQGSEGERRQQASGAGGRFPTIPVKLKRLTLVKNASRFCEFVEVSALVPEEVGRLPYVILGRDYVFKKFDITFQENRHKFIFHRI
jgi:predicted aspartyl protease